ncbi:MAG: rRNA small subunit 7-methylguanosine (m7G) methyltransferase GidB [uncultured Campylobacterales bacterium]|uniref:Ribosomal RNA small subunit methyltransferase G n=1 Tax=uncultured Campylobacterales bacterium TaxID=352960 RepID=A0A6S6SFA8_9BACT|nr:MAG: rRNA small subunit 7-methylguanosine (m7G) methyltransferase GidB [uncultured Campylobacterales bacterium]
MEYNQVHNITGLKSASDIKSNITDSLYPLKYLKLKDIKTALDVGTGAGFPGLLIAIQNPNIEYTLCEPMHKKSAFLRLCKVELDIKNITIETKRVEELNSTFDLITSRAVCNADKFLKITSNVTAKNTSILLYKGSNAKEELSNIKHTIHNNKNRNYVLIKNLKC